MKLIRLKPYLPKRGQNVQNFAYQGKQYKQGVWYEVADDTAAYLGTLRQSEANPGSPFMFDVGDDEAHAAQIEQKHQKSIAPPSPAHTTATGLRVVRATPAPLTPDAAERAQKARDDRDEEERRQFEAEEKIENDPALAAAAQRLAGDKKRSVPGKRLTRTPNLTPPAPYVPPTDGGPPPGGPAEKNPKTREQLAASADPEGSAAGLPRGPGVPGAPTGGRKAAGG